MINTLFKLILVALILVALILVALILVALILVALILVAAGFSLRFFKKRRLKPAATSFTYTY